MRRPIVFVALAGMAAILAAVVVFSSLKKREAEVSRAMARTTEIVVAAHDLPIGSRLDTAALRVVRWSRDSIPQGAFTDPEALNGSFVKSQFVANEPIVTAKLFMGEKASGIMPLLIPNGMRAMSVPVDEVADIAGFVQPHTRVDVLVAISGGGAEQQSFSRIVLQNVEVLAVAQEIEHPNDQPQVVKVVTLLVSPEDSEKLSLASKEGSLRLAMRNFADTKMVLTSGAEIRDLLRGGTGAMPIMPPQPQPVTARIAAPAPTAPKPLTVEIMRDGKSAESVSFVNAAVTGRRLMAESPGSAQPPPASGTPASGAAATPQASAPGASPPQASAPEASAPAAYVAEPKTFDIPK